MENNICVIDDDGISNFITTRLIHKVSPGSHISCFENGQSAINYLTGKHHEKQPQPDYIFLDISMPVMDGWQFLDILDDLQFDPNFDTKVFIITTSLLQSDFQKGKKHPRIIDVFIKPLDIEKIKISFPQIIPETPDN